MRNVTCILHPTDFSPYSDAALQVASDLARVSHARIILLHVHHAPVGIAGTVPIAVLPAADDSEEAKQLQQVQPPHPELSIERRLQSGDPSSVILSVAEECRADLIVMGTHGRTGIGRAAMGSVAEQVASRAKCAVVMVKDVLTEARI